MQLEQQLREMQSELECLVSDQKELQEHLLRVVKERKMMALVLTDLEEEHDMAIKKIEQLEGKVNMFSLCIPFITHLHIDYYSFYTVKMTLIFPLSLWYQLKVLSFSL